MKIKLDDLTGPEIHALLQEHLDDMHRISPPESIHALDLSGLRVPEILFWTVWDDIGDEDVLIGCGALKELDATHGEIKSMRTSSQHRRKGVARAVLTHIIEEAKRRGYRRLSLETGAHGPFQPAHRLYEWAGFTRCGPFGDYTDDPNSIFMTKEL
ncbi:MAG: GNAT family N-acetyltransferase [Hormoscilla sp. GUM202]|nr:GNAT family N-acetyltransferase [Hormoscilla sp. GUM202]